MVGRWFSRGTLVPPPIKADPQDLAEILIKVALIPYFDIHVYTKYIAKSS